MPDQPRVLFLDQSGALGGAELSLLDIVRLRTQQGGADTVALLSDGPFRERLAEHRIDCVVEPLAVEVQKNAGVLNQALAAPRVWSLARRLAKLARQHDAIYANTQKAAVVGALAAWLAGRPLVWHLRDMLDADHFSRANRQVVVAMTNRVASLIIANSQATADAYRRAGGTVRLEVVHNGVDEAPFQEAAGTDRSAIRSSLGASEAPLVGVFGRLTPWKGQHVLLDALERESLTHTHALIVGEALFTDEDRQYADGLRQRTESGPLAGRVHWLGQRNDVPALMHTCDAVIHCSEMPEPFGRVILEGQLAGKPVIASAAGGALEILEEGVTGLLTPPGDADALAGALAQILGEPDFARRLAEAGKARAIERFGLIRCVSQVNGLLDSIVAG